MAVSNLSLCTLIAFLSVTAICGSVLSNLEHLSNNATSVNGHIGGWLSDASSPSEHSHYAQASNEFSPSAEDLFANHYPSRLGSHMYRNPHFIDLESHQRRIASQYSSDGRYDYRSSPHQDHQPMHSIPEYDSAPLKKHDFSGGNNYGGWDMFSGGGFNLGGLGSGFAQAGQAVKKGKEAKALFVLMAPLILLAVFGPFLATQAMIPWIANGGLTSVSTVAGSAGRKRRKRSNYDPRQMAELEKRLQLFLEVQDFIAKTGSSEFAEEMGEAFLQCQKYTERRNKCLERVACEYTDNTSAMDPAERRIAKMVLQNVMLNSMVPASIKGRLSKGSMFGKNHPGRCKNYWCEAIDNSKGKP